MASAQIVLPVPGGPAKLKASASPLGCRSPRPQRLKMRSCCVTCARAVSSARRVAGGRITSSNVRRGTIDSTARRLVPNSRVNGIGATPPPYRLSGLQAREPRPGQSPRRIRAAATARALRIACQCLARNKRQRRIPRYDHHRGICPSAGKIPGARTASSDVALNWPFFPVHFGTPVAFDHRRAHRERRLPGPFRSSPRSRIGRRHRRSRRG